MLDWLKSFFSSSSRLERSINDKSIKLSVDCFYDNTSVKLADHVKIWNDGTSNTIKLFELGGDTNYVGKVDSRIVAKHLQNNGLGIAFVEKASRRNVTISVSLDLFERPQEEIQAEINQQRIDRLNSPYTPRKPLVSTFFSESIIDLSSSTIEANSLEQVINDIENIEKHLYLVGKDGHTIMVENRTGTPNSIKFMRAIYSGVKFELVEINKNGYFYNLYFRPIYAKT